MTHARVEFSGQTFSVSPDGFTWKRRDGQELIGPWSRVTEVTALATSGSINGVHVGDWQHFGIALDDGSGFHTHSRSEEMFAVAALTVQYAGLQILERARQRLSAGQPVQFGPVTLSREALTFKRRTWKISELAGHKTYQGTWMLDAGPVEAPKLVASVMLNRLPNAFALCALLNELRPGLEYEDGIDKGSIFRPSASSHDPRYVSGRTRLLGFGGLIAAGLLAVLGTVVYEAVVGSAYDRFEQKTAAHNVLYLAVMRATPVEPGKPWQCDVKLTNLYDVWFATRGPKDLPRPGLLDRDAPFELWDSGLTIPGSSPAWMLLAEVKAVSPPAETRTVTLVYQLLEAGTARVRCSGEQELAFAGTNAYRSEERQLEDAIESALKWAVCAPGGKHCEPGSVEVHPPGKLPALGKVTAAADPPAPKLKQKPRRSAK